MNDTSKEPLLAEGSNAPELSSASVGTLPDLPKKQKVWVKVVLSIVVILLVLGIFLGALGGIVYLKAREMMGSGTALQQSLQASYTAIKSQNLVESKTKLVEAQAQLQDVKKKYDGLGFMRFIPFAGAYYNDGKHGLNAGQSALEAADVALQAIEPYADVLGFSGAGTFTGGSVENRIQLALATLPKIMPVMDQLSGKLENVQSELSQIDERRYPESFRGMVIREKITSAKAFAAGAKEVVTQGKPVLEVLPDIAGATGKRKRYFILFQNDNERRPTGGFMTAFATLLVENGHVTPERSDDIYELDKKFRNKPEIPAILKTYLKTETRWNLRDMNLSPDFKNSMDVFWSYYSKLPGENAKDVDGIITVDTAVLENLVAVLGPVEVPGYGTFSAQNDKRCDCPQIIYALSEIVDRPTPFLRANRKGIIGPMMQSVLQKAYTAPKQLWPALFGSAWKNIEEKHVQFYFFDEKTQAAAESINAAGRVKPTPANSDYLFIVDANLGGAKSNLFVKTSIEQEVEVPQNGVLKKTITMTYKNPFPPSNCNLEAGQLCLNGKLTDWLRIYLPEGAKVTDSLGFDTGTTKTSDELGHAVFEGVFTLQPLNQVKVKITYTVPYTDTKTYRLFMQKQGGAEDITHLMTVNGGQQQVVLDKDKAVTIPF